MSNKGFLILGHGRHGKDTFADLLSEWGGWKFMSSSRVAGKVAVWPKFGQHHYPDFETCYADRHQHRETWFNLISEYNTPDKTRTMRAMLAEGADGYIGMRNIGEVLACWGAGLTRQIFYVTAGHRLPEEPESSNTATMENLDYFDIPYTIVYNYRPLECPKGGMIKQAKQIALDLHKEDSECTTH